MKLLRALGLVHPREQGCPPRFLGCNAPAYQHISDDVSHCGGLPSHHFWLHAWWSGGVEELQRGYARVGLNAIYLKPLFFSGGFFWGFFSFLLSSFCLSFSLVA